MAMLHEFIQSLTPEQKHMLRTVVKAPETLLGNHNDPRGLNSCRAAVCRAIERELGEEPKDKEHRCGRKTACLGCSDCKETP